MDFTWFHVNTSGANHGESWPLRSFGKSVNRQFGLIEELTSRAATASHRASVRNYDDITTRGRQLGRLEGAVTAIRSAILEPLWSSVGWITSGVYREYTVYIYMYIYIYDNIWIYIYIYICIDICNISWSFQWIRSNHCHHLAVTHLSLPITNSL